LLSERSLPATRLLPQRDVRRVEDEDSLEIGVEHGKSGDGHTGQRIAPRRDRGSAVDAVDKDAVRQAFGVDHRRLRSGSDQGDRQGDVGVFGIAPGGDVDRIARGGSGERGADRRIAATGSGVLVDAQACRRGRAGGGETCRGKNEALMVNNQAALACSARVVQPACARLRLTVEERPRRTISMPPAAGRLRATRRSCGCRRGQPRRLVKGHMTSLQVRRRIRYFNSRKSIVPGGARGLQNRRGARRRPW